MLIFTGEIYKIFAENRNCEGVAELKKAAEAHIAGSATPSSATHTYTTIYSLSDYTPEEAAARA